MAEKKSKKANSKHLHADVKRIGIRLKGIRKGLGFGNSDIFANHYNLDRAQYGKYEAGSQDLRVSSLIAVLEAIDMKISDFFNEEYDRIEVQLNSEAVESESTENLSSNKKDK